MPPLLKKLSRVLWPIFLLGHWLSCGFVAWMLLAQVNFAYPLAYQALNIDQHIAQYGPQNRYRDNFSDTSKQQHIELFSQINLAIHHDASELANITFTPRTGDTQTLLRADEVLHLTDVAHLIDEVYLLGISAVIAMIISGVLLRGNRSPLPRPKHVVFSVCGTIAILVVAVLIIGSKKVFYYLHTWVFPPEHPWFFYYQDSLMTTLMKAPDLFGFIAALLLILWLLLWGATLFIIARLWPRSRLSAKK
ncbi:lipoprotein intramolecular transacylase Lit [Gilvimarinus polysaccharolyticus]|uniref:lipoprotein intramolecular transacylase Lit n=1 Tax=Gilvimarinus polysaccharolyticus TaxID=863921 RepID=UPI000673C6E2|nr:DUF1461 domain-containing protein [Gilvimarinus polysaccharolyticus]